MDRKRKDRRICFSRRERCKICTADGLVKGKNRKGTKRKRERKKEGSEHSTQSEAIQSNYQNSRIPSQDSAPRHHLIYPSHLTHPVPLVLAQGRIRQTREPRLQHRPLSARSDKERSGFDPSFRGSGSLSARAGGHMAVWVFLPQSPS
jgi:hypothetical protein